MKEILKFKDLGILYSLKVDNNELIYQKNENGNISTNLNKDEIKLINTIFFNLIPSQNIKNLGYINYNNKKINHLYDLNNSFHIFYENEKDITEDCLTLNDIFNNQEEYLALKETNSNNNSKYTKRKVKVGKKVISVLVLSTFILTTSVFYIKGIHNLVSLISNHIKEHKYYEEVEKYQDRQLTVEEIIASINNNPQLTQEEKEFFLSAKNFFNDNIEYFDYYTVIDNLNNLHIEYIKEESKNPGQYEDFTYTQDAKGRIRVYKSTNFSDAPKYALSHGFLHAFTKMSNTDNYFYEGLHVLINNEYFGNSFYDNGYKVLKNYVYIICELINPEVLRQYHAHNDIKYLIDALTKIIPDENMAITLLTDIDFICEAEILRNSSQEKYNKLKAEYSLKTNEIDILLKKYYQAKFQISPEEDLYAFFCFNPLNACTKIASELDFSLNAFRKADEFTIIKQYKKIFNKTGYDNLVLSLCDEVKEVPKLYTLDDLLNGETDFLYRTKDEINLPQVTEGLYQGIAYEPNHYIDYEVVSREDLKDKNK